MKCKLCGSYNDPTEWPAEDRPDYTPDLCHDCWILEKEDEDADSEEPTDSVDDDDQDDGFDPEEEPDEIEDDQEEGDADGEN